MADPEAWHNEYFLRIIHDPDFHRSLEGLIVHEASEMKALYSASLESASNCLEEPQSSGTVQTEIAESTAWWSAIKEPTMSRLFLSGRGLDERTIRDGILAKRVSQGFELIASISLEFHDIWEAIQAQKGGEFLHKVKAGGEEILVYWVDGVFHALRLGSEVEVGQLVFSEAMRQESVAELDVCVVDDYIYIRRSPK